VWWSLSSASAAAESHHRNSARRPMNQARMSKRFLAIELGLMVVAAGGD
jgi:hypothetical protein